MDPQRSRPYPSLVEALRLLPNIRPVYERHRLGEAKHHASCSSEQNASINGVSVTLADLEQLFLSSESGSPRVSHQGAAFLLRLFAQGAFEPSSEWRSVEGGVELLTQYAEGKVTLLDSRFWRRQRRRRPPARERKAEQAPTPAVEGPIARLPAWGAVTVHVLA